MQKPVKKNPIDLTELQSQEFSELFSIEDENPLDNGYIASAKQSSPWKIMVFDRFTQ